MLKTLFKVVSVTILLCVIVIVGLALLLLEPAPRVLKQPPADPDDVVAARTFVRDVRRALSSDAASPSVLETDVATLNGALRLGARLVPGFRGTVETSGGEITGNASVPVRIGQATQWLNATLMAPSFEGDFALSHVRIGRVALPPNLALAAMRTGANVVAGDGLGDTILGAASRMEIRGDKIDFALTMSEMGGNGIMRGVFSTLRGQEMPGSDDIARYYTRIRDAMESGDLPETGSYLPYLRFTLAAAQEGAAREGVPNAYTSALFALTLVCGARDFTLVVGGLADIDVDNSRNWTTSCDNVTLNGRIDSRRHFTTAAALQAASNRGFAVSVGEFKELHDTLKAGGFDFTDIAANNSGIRMSNTFMDAAITEWPMLLDAIGGEQDVIVSFKGIPGLMSETAFADRFGDIESPAYAEQVAVIEERIDSLALHSLWN